MQYEKFLNQTGNFALSLITSGEKSSVTDAQIASIKAITSSLDEISPFVLQAKEKMDIGEITLGGPIRTSGVTTLSSALGQIENDFLPYGQLNYDGEYSQHTEDIKPKFLDKAQEMSSDDALKIAKQLVGSDSNDIKLLYETNGSIPVYAYGNKNLTIEITKNGGIVLSIHNKRDVRESKVSKDSASKTALQFAEKLGFKGLSCRYITQSDNILTVELIGSQDNVTIYPDRVTVGVALDNGKVVYFDSRGYILSHTERTLTLPDEIPDGANLAIIPTKGNLEHLCFEYEEEDHIRYVCTTEGTCYAVHPFGDGERDGLISR
jgi:germination protein YpeB